MLPDHFEPKAIRRIKRVGAGDILVVVTNAVAVGVVVGVDSLDPDIQAEHSNEGAFPGIRQTVVIQVLPQGQIHGGRFRGFAEGGIGQGGFDGEISDGADFYPHAETDGGAERIGLVIVRREGGVHRHLEAIIFARCQVGHHRGFDLRAREGFKHDRGIRDVDRVAHLVAHHAGDLVVGRGRKGVGGREQGAAHAERHEREGPTGEERGGGAKSCSLCFHGWGSVARIGVSDEMQLHVGHRLDEPVQALIRVV